MAMVISFNIINIKLIPIKYKNKQQNKLKISTAPDNKKDTTLTYLRLQCL